VYVERVEAGLSGFQTKHWYALGHELGIIFRNISTNGNHDVAEAQSAMEILDDIRPVIGDVDDPVVDDASTTDSTTAASGDDSTERAITSR